MANPEHLSGLISDIAIWNQWRLDNPDIRPDLQAADLREADLRGAYLHAAHLQSADLCEANLTGADLTGAHLSGANLQFARLREAHLSSAHLNGANLQFANLQNANLSGAHLSGANLRRADLSRAHLNRADLGRADLNGAHLHRANLTEADLGRADLGRADLSKANLSGAHLSGANLGRADLSDGDLRGADLTAARLERAILIGATCDKAIFTGCRVHGLSAWNLQLADTQQTNLIITAWGEPEITVDSLEVAQFICLLLSKQRISHIDVTTSKVVLILGRFAPERKVVLEAIRDQLRRRDYLPVLFDFDKPRSPTTLETINTLAGLARFVIADITDEKSVLEELTMIVQRRPLLPIQPVLLASQEEPGMFDFFRAFPWFLNTLRYREQEELLETLQVNVILPAEEKAKELAFSQRK